MNANGTYGPGLRCVPSDYGQFFTTSGTIP